MARQSRSMAFWMGYASVLTLYPRVANPARLYAFHFGREDDFLPIAVDWVQIRQDVGSAFQHVAEAVEDESEHQPA